MGYSNHLVLKQITESISLHNKPIIFYLYNIISYICRCETSTVLTHPVAQETPTITEVSKDRVSEKATKVKNIIIIKLIISENAWARIPICNE